MCPNAEEFVEKGKGEEAIVAPRFPFFCSLVVLLRLENAKERPPTVQYAENSASAGVLERWAGWMPQTWARDCDMIALPCGEGNVETPHDRGIRNARPKQALPRV